MCSVRIGNLSSRGVAGLYEVKASTLREIAEPSHFTKPDLDMGDVLTPCQIVRVA